MWSAEPDVGWITIMGGMPRYGDDRVTFSVARNTTGAPRSGHITVKDKVVLITQAAS